MSVQHSHSRHPEAEVHRDPVLPVVDRNRMTDGVVEGRLEEAGIHSGYMGNC